MCGVGTTVPGIDVSVYQGTINWPEVKAAGYVYAYVRVSDGLNTLDTEFANNWAGSRSAGVYHGAYQFFEPSQDPVAQAKLLLSKTGPMQADDLPPMIDVEVTDGLSSAEVAAAVKTWVDYVAGQIGRPPVVYTGMYFWQDDVDNLDISTSPLFHAQYTTATCPNIASPPWATWAFWQWTSTGTVSGISGAMDLDRWNGNLAALEAFLGPPGSCGDGTCSASETQISCPEDCGPCGTVDATNGFLIDNGDACFEGGGPAAYLRQVTTAGYDDTLVWTHTTSDATEANYATWDLYFAAAGSYRVDVYTAAAFAQSKQANYVVTGAGSATSSVVVDQTAVDGWQTLGEFDFAQGGHQSIHVGDNTGEPSANNVQLVFDAVRILPAATGSDGSGGSNAGGGGSDETDGGGDGTVPGSHAGCSAGANGTGGGLAFALIGAALMRGRRRPSSASRSR